MQTSSIAVLSAALLLSGCVAPPYPYPTAGYPPPPPSYPPSAYPPPPPGEAYVGADGLTYVDGYPVTVYEGAPLPWLFLPSLGGWGYYDGFHRWHGAPPDIRGRLEHDHPGGRGLPPTPGRFRGAPPPPAARPGFGPAAAAVRVPPPGRPPGPPPAATVQRPPPERRQPEERRNCPPNNANCGR